mmetsp:Transcript_1885/g.2876  ORF Transcript_1885/g.2876 Transcript_1885/m.2876 type:complete len:377 (-) Transcript_1885:11-1141(-)
MAEQQKGVLDGVGLDVLSKRLGVEVKELKEQKKLKGGLSSSLTLVSVVVEGDKEQRFVVKTKDAGPSSSVAKDLGLAREFLFYDNLAEKIPEEFAPPKMIWGEGSLDSGHMMIYLEEVRGIQAGYFFGPGNPNNWELDLKEETKGVEMSEKDISLMALRQVAFLHSTYWQDKSLLTHPWLRCADWRTGMGKEGWLGSQNYAKSNWESRNEKFGDEVKWDPLLEEVVDASFAKISWEKLQEQEEAYTLIHGDFHPANMMLRDGKLVILDFEVMGIGNGAQDVGQFLMSHTSVENRRVNEDEFLHTYYNALVEGGVKNYSFEQCKSDVVAGGVGRWVWLLGCTISICSAKMNQYFQDQVAAFIKDHGVTKETVPMPRA